MRVLVTGGAGFIGSNLVDRLVADGDTVAIVDNCSSGTEENLAAHLATGTVRLHRLDIRSEDLASVFEAERPEAVAHLAAQIDVRVSVADPVLDADVNVLGTLNVLERARAAGVRKVLVASSGGCIYGDARALPIRESFRGRPTSPYGIGKKVLHEYLAFYRQTHGLRSATLALSNVYGPRQDPHGEAGVVAIFLRAMLQGLPTTIYGDGSQSRDFVYVADVVDAFARALDRGEGVFNVGTGVETSVLDLWQACAALTDYPGEPRFAPPRLGELQRSALDASRAARGLDWTPRVGLPEGLRETARWIAASTGSTLPS